MIQLTYSLRKVPKEEKWIIYVRPKGTTSASETVVEEFTGTEGHDAAKAEIKRLRKRTAATAATAATAPKAGKGKTTGKRKTTKGGNGEDIGGGGGGGGPKPKKPKGVGKQTRQGVKFTPAELSALAAQRTQAEIQGIKDQLRTTQKEVVKEKLGFAATDVNTKIRVGELKSAHPGVPEAVLREAAQQGVAAASAYREGTPEKEIILSRNKAEEKYIFESYDRALDQKQLQQQGIPSDEAEAIVTNARTKYVHTEGNFGLRDKAYMKELINLSRKFFNPGAPPLTEYHLPGLHQGNRDRIGIYIKDTPANKEKRRKIAQQELSIRTGVPKNQIEVDESGLPVDPAIVKIAELSNEFMTFLDSLPLNIQNDKSMKAFLRMVAPDMTLSATKEDWDRMTEELVATATSIDEGVKPVLDYIPRQIEDVSMFSKAELAQEAEEETKTDIPSSTSSSGRQPRSASQSTLEDTSKAAAKAAKAAAKAAKDRRDELGDVDMAAAAAAVVPVQMPLAQPSGPAAFVPASFSSAGSFQPAASQQPLFADDAFVFGPEPEVAPLVFEEDELVSPPPPPPTIRIRKQKPPVVAGQFAAPLAAQQPLVAQEMALVPFGNARPVDFLTEERRVRGGGGGALKSQRLDPQAENAVRPSMRQERERQRKRPQLYLQDNDERRAELNQLVPAWTSSQPAQPGPFVAEDVGGAGLFGDDDLAGL
jgi:hypothetical protein